MAFADLTTLADVRAWLQTGQSPFPITDDALLTRLITAVSREFRSWLNRPLEQQDWIEVQDGLTGFFGQPEARFQFSVYPVSAVLSVVVDGITIPAALTAHAAGYVFSPTQLVVRGYTVPRKARCVTMQYTAGYAVIPDDLVQTCIEVVVRKYRERTRIAERSRSLGGQETVAYETVMFTRRDITSDIQLLLEQYRRSAPVSTGFVQQAPTATDPALLVGGVA